MKANQEQLFEEEINQKVEDVFEKKEKLTEENLSKMDQKSHKSATKSLKSSKKNTKPAWATTEKEQEDAKEAEIDDLLEFAYDLDYDKYMDDFEVRQLFSIIKDRITEIKKDQDWKKNIADEWNRAVEEDHKAAEDKKSVYSYSKLHFF